MDKFFVEGSKNGFSIKLWRGEKMCLLGFNVENPEPDFVGFAVEFKEPSSSEWKKLHNRLNFQYDNLTNGYRNYPTTDAPIQKFRWIHFPWQPKSGKYTYRVTKMHMPRDNKLKKGLSITRSISLDPITYHDFLDIGFTRNFASSQAFIDYKKNHNIADTQKIIPSDADEGFDFAPDKNSLEPTGIYKWMEFEGGEMIFDFLQEAVNDNSIEIDAMMYDFNEPDMLELLKKMGSRLRVIIDDSGKDEPGKRSGHLPSSSCESKAAKQFRQSAGTSRVRRGHFKNLQHNKVFIAKRNGVPFKVLTGSTNFSYRGLYIQANNVLVFSNEEIAGLYEKMFELAFNDMDNFKKDPFAAKWHLIKPDNFPAVSICFSPHKSPELSLNPVGGAIDQADSSVLYAIAFLYQTTTGATRRAINRLMKKSVFSYGISDKKGKLQLLKPDGSQGQLDFSYLAKNAPEPFKSEWSGGKGINIHHKFVVTDFDKPTAKLFTGSSNLAPSGEKGNGDNLIMIEDQKIATVFAIEALRMFDHLHFRSNMKKAGKKAPGMLVLQKPVAISGKKYSWFDKYYVPGSQREKDRKLFAGLS